MDKKDLEKTESLKGVSVDSAGSAARVLNVPENVSSFEDANSGWILCRHKKTMEEFLKRSSSDRLADLSRLAADTREKLKEKLNHYNVAENERQTVLGIFNECCAVVLLRKLEVISRAYNASGTDFELASGRLWAAQNKCADYLGLIFGTEEKHQVSSICPGAEEALFKAIGVKPA